MDSVAELIKALDALQALAEDRALPVTVADRTGRRYRLVVETGPFSGVVLVPVGEPVNHP